MKHSNESIDSRNEILDFELIGRLPLPGDNTAIATRDLEPGTCFRINGDVHKISHGILEGHRFAIAPIAQAGELLSWNLPFGRALRAIRPGEYLCNAGVLDALRLRNPAFELPRLANFQNAAATYVLDETACRPGRQIALHATTGTFMGYRRTGGRGVGTRNVIVVLGTSSATAAFARQLAGQLKADVAGLANVDDIAAVAHTEGAGTSKPNNLEFVLRALAGFIVHPNVAAVLAVDLDGEYVDNVRLRDCLNAGSYPLQHVPHCFYTIRKDLKQSLRECAEIVRGWFAVANDAERQQCPLSELKIALQCGGSDAFSGVSGNPLAGWVAREVIRHGGAAGLAETDELIGAESYMLTNVRNLEVARRFLEKIDTFRKRIAWHGHSAEGNPSGGNLFRGLYNISLKSIGAARKKDPDVRLDYVIDYAERMREPGFYFMDSPGNDLESIAGQVASGCNLIFFITGNGSITNFPFVPTVKFITTTRRWALLSQDMDVNAGRYQDGETLEDLGLETFDYAVRVASGMQSSGERAGHSQVSIWRDWQQTDGSRLESLQRASAPPGQPVRIKPSPASATRIVMAASHRKVGLILPTSLCSGQIALQIAGELNRRFRNDRHGLSRFVALPHTEGCGVSTGENEAHYLRTVVGHLRHPMVGAALLLEHGCERTHNDLMRHTLEKHGVDPERFGYASIQLDGGIDAVRHKVIDWFAGLPAAEDIEDDCEPGARRLCSIGLTAHGPVPRNTARALAILTIDYLSSGGSVIVPSCASLVRNGDFLSCLGQDTQPDDTLAYGQMPRRPGLHVMGTPTENFVEALTGLGATGAQIIVAHLAGATLQGHPMIPTLQIASARSGDNAFAPDFDLLIDPERDDPERIRDQVLARIRETLICEYAPSAWSRGHTDFQVTRGRLGISL